MKEHTLKAFEQELRQIRERVQELGEASLRQLEGAMAALAARDEDLARRVAAGDEAINALEREVDRSVLLVLALREPKAGDLRLVVACSKIASDLERIADYAKNIAGRVGRLKSLAPECNGESLGEMGRLAAALLRDILAAFAAQDADRALAVRRADQDLDRAFVGLITRLSDCIQGIQGQDVEGKGIVSALFAARCLERIGDHVANIAEHIHFLVRAEYPAED